MVFITCYANKYPSLPGNEDNGIKSDSVCSRLKAYNTLKDKILIFISETNRTNGMSTSPANA